MRRFFRRVVVATVLVSVVFTAVLIGRTFWVESLQIEPAPHDGVQVSEKANDRLAEAIRIETLSNADPETHELEPFDEFHRWASGSFPRVHAELERHAVEPCSSYYVWPGSDESLAPVLFASHIDVVPVEDHERPEWTHPPFSGAIAQGYIWGRGALDVKVGVVGLLEAAEALLSNGFEPRRTVFFAFGCDEEVGGRQGASRIAQRFSKDGRRFAWVLDEGHVITRGIFPGLEQPVAFVGLSEKGFATVELKVSAQGGHSSMPPSQTAVGILSRAVARLEANPLPPSVNEPVRSMFGTLAPEMGFGERLVFRNLWLFEPVVLRALTAKNTTNATVRTTMAATMFNAGVQDNVLAKRATAMVNFRLAPGHDIEFVRNYVEDIVDDTRVEVSVPERGFKSNPSPVSSATTQGFRAIASSVRGAFGESYLVSPSLTVGGTDSRYYTDLADDVYRFLPVELTAEDTARIHGIDERVSTENYRKAIDFYRLVLRAAAE